MYINTTEAASYLKISPRRVRTLLKEGRVRGAYKCGHIWLIPLYNGIPQIAERDRGQKGTWKRKRRPKRTIIHVNRNKIASNLKKSPEEREAIIAVKCEKNTYVHELEIPFPCKLVYRPDSPLDCQASVWIEVLDYDIEKILPSLTNGQKIQLASEIF